MAIGENEPNTEWECPTCARLFMVDDPENLRAEPQTSGLDLFTHITIPDGTHGLDTDELRWVLERFLQGESRTEVRKNLLDSGYPRDQADTLLRLAAEREIELRHENQFGKQPIGKTLRQNAIIGSLLLLAGLIVTAGSLALANFIGCGSFLIASGAIIWGIMHLLRALGQLIARTAQANGENQSYDL